MKHLRFLLVIIITSYSLLISNGVIAQTTDSLIVETLRQSNIRFSHDNSVTLLLSGQEKFDDMFQAIRQAKSSIHLEYFNFRNDSIASLLFDILREKRKEGVEVRAMFDGFGNDSNNQPLKKYHLEALRKDSIDIVEYSPIRFPWVNHIFGRDHRKIVVIDGQIAYTTYTKGRKMVGIINREPHVTPKIMRTFYINAINQAQDSIHIINPYFTLIPSVTRALTRAIRRGVKVEIMLSSKSDIPLTPDCALYQARKLQKRGARVWLYKPGFHHSKIMMVDGRYCTVGSTNLDARSLKCDFEENAVIVDKATTRELDDMFWRDKQKSFEMTDQTWDEFRTGWQKFRGWFAHLLQPFL